MGALRDACVRSASLASPTDAPTERSTASPAQVGTHTTNVAQHVGGGVAAPGLAAIGLYYTRQSRNVQYALLIAFVVIMVAFYFLFYEEEESLEEVRAFNL
jgi:hypothetical protein